MPGSRCCKLPPGLFRELAHEVVQTARGQLWILPVPLLAAGESGIDVGDQFVLERILSDHVGAAKIRFPLLEQRPEIQVHDVAIRGASIGRLGVVGMLALAAWLWLVLDALGAAPNLPAEKLKSRALFIVARDDRNDVGLRLPGIRAQYEKAPGTKELIVLDGSAHAQFLFQTDQSDRVMREILRFLSTP